MSGAQKRVMICGVDCFRDDQHCNGYCTGRSNEPPVATPQQVRQAARHKAHHGLHALRQTWRDYLATCEPASMEHVRAQAVISQLDLAASL